MWRNNIVFFREGCCVHYVAFAGDKCNLWRVAFSISANDGDYLRLSPPGEISFVAASSLHRRRTDLQGAEPRLKSTSCVKGNASVCYNYPASSGDPGNRLLWRKRNLVPSGASKRIHLCCEEALVRKVLRNSTPPDKLHLLEFNKKCFTVRCPPGFCGQIDHCVNRNWLLFTDQRQEDIDHLAQSGPR